MRIKVLDRATLGFDLPFELLAELGELEVYDFTSPEELIPRISDADVIIINKIKITEDVIKNTPVLKLVCVFATGYDNVDVFCASENGVAVCNVPAYSTNSVTLFTMATVLSLCTHLNEYRAHVASGSYTEAGKSNCIVPVYHELSGKTWGIVGFGNIGRAVAKVAEALGAKIIVNKRVACDDYECVDIDRLCEESDIITLHVPLNESTRCLINRARISRMKKSVVLVNEARGAILDEEAVCDAVLEGRIGAFGCDVYSSEPFDKKHPYTKIMKLDNVCLTPHSAWGAYEARERCLKVIIENIKSYTRGETLNRVDILKQN